MFAAKGSMVVTNVPGPQRPLYLAGSRMRGVLGWAPMSGSVAMSVSIFSYDGRVSVGVMSDAGLVPDPHHIVRGFERELRRMKRLYLPHEKRSRAGARRPATVSRRGARTSRRSAGGRRGA
jgi:diacylglycerol O-acyltransferase / wax synthase